MSDLFPLLSAVGLHKTYRKHAVVTEVLKGVDLDVHAGEFLSIVGNSGSGKSTLLHLLGTLDKPDRGRITFDGRAASTICRPNGATSCATAPSASSSSSTICCRN